MGGFKFYGVNIDGYKHLLAGGGGGGAPPRKCRNMKCSRSDSWPILGLIGLVVKNNFPHKFTIFSEKKDLIFHKESKIKLFFHTYMYLQLFFLKTRGLSAWQLRLLFRYIQNIYPELENMFQFT